MTDSPTDDGAPTDWNVAFDQFSREAYRPGELIVSSTQIDALAALAADAGLEIEDPGEDDIDYAYLEEFTAYLPPNRRRVVVDSADARMIDAFVRRVAADPTIDAHLNTVFFADACRHVDCMPHPAWSASPAAANPAYANPVYANPAYANPAYANPASANPAYANMRTHNSALPASPAFEPRTASSECGFGANGPIVTLLDTGLADSSSIGPLLESAANVSGATDVPDSDSDGDLDPVAGHGTFIAGLIELAVPGVSMTVPRVIRYHGDVDLSAVQTDLERVFRQTLGGSGTNRVARMVVGMSFSGLMAEHNRTSLRQQLEVLGRFGAVVVASVGNDATCQPFFPAAFGDPTAPNPLANVVSVGALGPCGPAGFTNFGPWVRACAAGVALTSSFFQHEETAGARRSFDGWALWSGTSFSVPVVIGALVREMVLTGSTASDAVARLIDAPGLPGFQNLGTIVT